MLNGQNIPLIDSLYPLPMSRLRSAELRRLCIGKDRNLYCRSGPQRSCHDSHSFVELDIYLVGMCAFIAYWYTIFNSGVSYSQYGCLERDSFSPSSPPRWCSKFPRMLFLDFVFWTIVVKCCLLVNDLSSVTSSYVDHGLCFTSSPTQVT